VTDVSVIIPARNEEFLQRTINSVLKKARADTEVIVVLDGYIPDPPIIGHPKVKLVSYPSLAIGQRAAVNAGVDRSDAKFIMKLDAHCDVDKGFDVKLMENCEEDWTVLPRMYVLDAFHWVCLKCGREYPQGPTKVDCDKCGRKKFNKRIVWKRKKRKRSDYMWFDTAMRIKYFDSPSLRPHGEVVDVKKRCHHRKRDWAQGDVTDVMCGLGACFFMHRERFWELEGMDEAHGGWGQMAVEVACKAWLSGGRHVVNKGTWFAHLPRTQPGFAFPYPLTGIEQERAREYSRDLWTNNKWHKQKYDLEWLIDRFSPLPDWEKQGGYDGVSN